MGLSDYKINGFSKPVSALDDTPQMSAAELKEWFDSNSTKEIKKSINGIIDELEDVDVSKFDKTKQHTHDNKATLDNIDEEISGISQKIISLATKTELQDNIDFEHNYSANTYATKEEVNSSNGEFNGKINEVKNTLSDIETVLDNIIESKGALYFYLEGKQYNVLKCTWGDFVNSEYNDGTFVVLEENGMSFVCVDGEKVCDMMSTTVRLTDEIIKGYNYILVDTEVM